MKVQMNLVAQSQATKISKKAVIVTLSTILNKISKN